MPNTRLNILLLDSGKEWGGGTNSMLELLKRIDRNRFAVHCCFYQNYQRDNQESIQDALSALGIPVSFIPQRKQPAWAKWAKEIARTLLFFSKPLRLRAVYQLDGVWRIRPNARRLAAMLADRHIDVLYMNNQPGSNVEGYLAAQNMPVAVVQHCRIEPVMTAQLAALVNHNARAIIPVSQGVERALLQSGVTPALCHTVFNGIDVNQPLPDGDRLRLALGVDRQTLLIGSIGSLIPRKANHHTLQALDLFHRAHPGARWKMVLVGTGPEQARLASMAADFGITDHLIFTGFQRNAMEYLAAFDVFVLASSSEGLPRVVLEAMLLHTPVIGSDVTGTAELVHHQHTGLLFPYGDIALLSEHLQTLYQDANLRHQLAQHANLMVREHFTIENYVTGVEAVLGALPPRGHHV